MASVLTRIKAKRDKTISMFLILRLEVRRKRKLILKGGRETIKLLKIFAHSLTSIVRELKQRMIYDFNYCITEAKSLCSDKLIKTIARILKNFRTSSGLGC